MNDAYKSGLTLGESKKLMLKYIDEYSIGGAVVSDADNQDYLLRHNALADAAQLQLARLFPLTRLHIINCRPLSEQLAAGGIGRSYVYPGKSWQLLADAAGAYYAELSGSGTFRVEALLGGSWQLLEEQVLGAVCGKVLAADISAPGASAVRLVVDAATPLLVQNAALYKYHYAADGVPPCRSYVEYRMPADFMRLHKLEVEGDGWRGREGLFTWQDPRTLILPGDIDAQLKLHYHAYPPKIGDDTADSYEIPQRPEVARLIPLKVAQLVIPTERAALAERLGQQFDAEVAQLQQLERSQEFASVQAVYRM